MHTSTCMYLTTFFFTSPPSFLSYRRWDSCRRLSSRLAANAVGHPSFSGWSTCRRNCSGCADSRSLIFSQPAHAVRRRRMWSIRSTIVGERRCRLVREGKNDGVVRWASRTSTPAIPTSTTSRTSLAEAVVRLKQCPPARQLLMAELPLDHSAAGLAVFGGSAPISGPDADKTGAVQRDSLRTQRRQTVGQCRAVCANRKT